MGARFYGHSVLSLDCTIVCHFPYTKTGCILLGFVNLSWSFLIFNFKTNIQFIGIASPVVPHYFTVSSSRKVEKSKKVCTLRGTRNILNLIELCYVIFHIKKTNFSRLGSSEVMVDWLIHNFGDQTRETISETRKSTKVCT